MQSDTEYRGNEAHERAARMEKLRADGENWEIYYRDPTTGTKWVMDYPDSHLHGGGSPRLRVVKS